MYICIGASTILHYSLIYSSPQVIAKVNHFDQSALQNLCCKCFSVSHDPQLVQLTAIVNQQLPYNTIASLLQARH